MFTNSQLLLEVHFSQIEYNEPAGPPSRYRKDIVNVTTKHNYMVMLTDYLNSDHGSDY